MTGAVWDGLVGVEGAGPVDGVEGVVGEVPAGVCAGVRVPGDVAPGLCGLPTGALARARPRALCRPRRRPVPRAGSGCGGRGWAASAATGDGRRRVARERPEAGTPSTDGSVGPVGHLAQRAQPAEARARGQQHRGAEQHGRRQCGHARGLRGLPSPIRGQLHRAMVERAASTDDRSGRRRRRSLARSLTIALVGLTLVLALAAAAGIGGIYSARQDYEDALARTYSLEAASSALFSAGVVEQAALQTTRPGGRGPAPPGARRLPRPRPPGPRAGGGRPGQPPARGSRGGGPGAGRAPEPRLGPVGPRRARA